MKLSVCFGLLAAVFVASSGVQAETPAGSVDHCNNGHVAFTFDDGVTVNTRKIVDLLVKYNQKATFFVNVNNYDCNYKPEYVKILRHAFAKNMTIASHTAGHPHMQNLTDDEIRFQIDQTNLYLKRLLGVEAKFIRIPYGENNDRIERIVKEKGMKTIGWTLDTEDSLGASQEDIYKSFLKLDKDSQDIVIMHDTHEDFANDTFERILKLMKSKGIKSSGMAKCLGKKHRKDAYTFYEPKHRKRQPSWNCNNIKVGQP